MYIDLNGVVVICGNYGSGKTETAVNLALDQKKMGKTVSIADLDLVNPYFRTREARGLLEQAGVRVILPDARYMHADLPILTPAVAGAIIKPGDLTILDAGGDNVGVTVLAALKDSLSGKKIEMLQVINPYRPFTETVAGCLKIKKEIEASAKLDVTGFISNAHIIDDTRAETVYNGYDTAMELSRSAGLPLVFVTSPAGLMDQLELNYFHCPVLPVSRKLIMPWTVG